MNLAQAIAYVFAALVGASIGLAVMGVDRWPIPLVAGFAWLAFALIVVVPVAVFVRGVRAEREQERRGRAARAKMDLRRHRGT